MIGFKRLALASAMVLVTAGGLAPAYSQTRAPAATRAHAQAEAAWPGLPPGAVEEVMTLRDGVRLAANVFKPEGKGPWPVVLSRTPYLKDGRVTEQSPNPGAAMAKAAKR